VGKAGSAEAGNCVGKLTELVLSFLFGVPLSSDWSSASLAALACWRKCHGQVLNALRSLSMTTYQRHQSLCTAHIDERRKHSRRKRQP
jgi:hypothetical protein